MNNAIAPQLLSLLEARQKLRCSEAVIHFAVENGELVQVTVDGEARYPLDSVKRAKAWVIANTVCCRRSK